jgi:hypothetical protein
MNDFKNEQVQIDIVRRYARPVAHLRQLCDSKRLGLVLGAGVSRNANLPDWKSLVEGITASLTARGISAADNSKESLPVQIQVLFALFRETVFALPELRELEDPYREAEVASRWRHLVHKVLYAGITDVEFAMTAHPYLARLFALSYKLPLVVSYNFDDLLERALQAHVRKLQDSHTIGYYTAWGPSFLIQEGRPVVYHPNGFLPFDLIDRYSDNIVLTEEALADQIIGFGLGEYAALLDYFCRTPCLFIGFSLEDAALRTLLRQSVHRSPGIVHYCVRWVPDRSMSEAQMRHIRETNFDLFNIVTLFLTNEDLSALLDMVAVLPETQINDRFRVAGRPRTYRYYIADRFLWERHRRYRGCAESKWSTSGSPLARQPLRSRVPSSAMLNETKSIFGSWIRFGSRMAASKRREEGFT